MKLSQGKLRLDIRRRFFAERMVSHQNRLPRKVTMAPVRAQGMSCYKV